MTLTVLFLLCTFAWECHSSEQTDRQTDRQIETELLQRPYLPLILKLFLVAFSNICKSNTQYKIIYIKRTNVMQLGSMFICNCNIALHVSDAFCVHLQAHLEIVEAASGEWHEKVWGVQQGVQGRWHAIDLGHLVGYLKFLSAPEDGGKKRPKHVEQYCSYK